MDIAVVCYRALATAARESAGQTCDFRVRAVHEEMAASYGWLARVSSMIGAASTDCPPPWRQVIRLTVPERAANDLSRPGQLSCPWNSGRVSCGAAPAPQLRGLWAPRIPVSAIVHPSPGGRRAAGLPRPPLCPPVRTVSRTPCRRRTARRPTESLCRPCVRRPK